MRIKANIDICAMMTKTLESDDRLMSAARWALEASLNLHGITG
jgi:hypothetical protein